MIPLEALWLIFALCSLVAMLNNNDRGTDRKKNKVCVLIREEFCKKKKKKKEGLKINQNTPPFDFEEVQINRKKKKTSRSA